MCPTLRMVSTQRITDDAVEQINRICVVVTKNHTNGNYSLISTLIRGLGLSLQKTVKCFCIKHRIKDNQPKSRGRSTEDQTMDQEHPSPHPSLSTGCVKWKARTTPYGSCGRKGRSSRRSVGVTATRHMLSANAMRSFTGTRRSPCTPRRSGRPAKAPRSGWPCGTRAPRPRRGRRRSWRRRRRGCGGSCRSSGRRRRRA